VLGNTEQGCGSHSKGNQDLPNVEKVVEGRNHGKKKDNKARKEEMWTTLRMSSPCESRVSEIHSEMQKPSVERRLAEPPKS